ncbi:uncharacterized protein LOC143444122 [Clavelina lepadiformis]|uniref:IRF tryptophan pentad repeat domain-containing protein n=1 Tax=Clavelina lepadiformis TaxID=159417 RepID=A0ABP0G471_CLALP
MTVNKQSRQKQKNVLMESRRLRLRDWLEMRIDDPNYPGLEWVNKSKRIFRIPWKHGARHGWSEDKDARLFREWSDHTGASPRDVKQHKANFRCALNSLRDVSQVQNLNKSKGDDAYRVYQMMPKRNNKRSNKWIKRRNSQFPKNSKSPVVAAPIPTDGHGVGLNHLNSIPNRQGACRSLPVQLPFTNCNPATLYPPTPFCQSTSGFNMGNRPENSSSKHPMNYESYYQTQSPMSSYTSGYSTDNTWPGSPYETNSISPNPYAQCSPFQEHSPGPTGPSSHHGLVYLSDTGITDQSLSTFLHGSTLSTNEMGPARAAESGTDGCLQICKNQSFSEAFVKDPETPEIFSPSWKERSNGFFPGETSRGANVEISHLLRYESELSFHAQHPSLTYQQDVTTSLNTEPGTGEFGIANSTTAALDLHSDTTTTLQRHSTLGKLHDFRGFTETITWAGCEPSFPGLGETPPNDDFCAYGTGMSSYQEPVHAGVQFPELEYEENFLNSAPEPNRPSSAETCQDIPIEISYYPLSVERVPDQEENLSPSFTGKGNRLPSAHTLLPSLADNNEPRSNLGALLCHA